MKNSILILISLFFLIGCEEEIVYPDGQKILPGLYVGSGTLDATIKFINKNIYTVKFNEPGSLVYEIRIKEIENECIRFDINSPGKNCKGNSNKFIIFKNLSSPYISLKFCVQYSGGWGWDELTFTFEGTKPL